MDKQKFLFVALVSLFTGCKDRAYIDRYNCTTQEQRTKMVDAIMRCGSGWNSDDCRREAKEIICDPHYSLWSGDSKGADCNPGLKPNALAACKQAGWKP